MNDLKLVYRDISVLKSRDRNPRTHTKRQIEQIAESIKAFGFTNPILIDDHNVVVAGHGRLEAAKTLDHKEVPTIRLSNLNKDELRAYVIADNRLAEKAGWDQEILAIELQSLSELELDFDITITGFDTPEIDILICNLDADKEEGDDFDEIPEKTDSAVTRLGDVWQIGPNRLICEDSTKAETYAHLLQEEKAQLIFTDPPYNVPINGHVSGLGKNRHREFSMATGEMSEAEFETFLSNVFENLTNHSDDGSIHFICMDWRHMGEVIAAGERHYSTLKNLCVWAKSNGGMGSLYRSQHELVFVYKSGTAKHINNVELGKHGRNRTNLWTYAGNSSFGKNRDADRAAHPTVKPVRLVSDAILDCSDRGAIVLDAFAGSGSTLIAAHKTGRLGYGIEIDPLYCDVIIDRLGQSFGLSAHLLKTGESFDEVKVRREKEAELIASESISEMEATDV